MRRPSPLSRPHPRHRPTPSGAVHGAAGARPGNGSPTAPTARVLRRLALGVVALVGASWLAGCGEEPTNEEALALSPDAFVEVLVAIREAEREAVLTDSAEVVFERRKREILADYGATEEDLRAFARAHQADFSLMNRLWDSIAQRLKYSPEELEGGGDLRIEQRR